jgi:hypothetical protein
MHAGVRRLRNGEEMREAILSALADGPLSSREILIRVGATHTARCALDALILSGRVVRRGSRVTFDFGHETLFQNAVKNHGKNLMNERKHAHQNDACNARYVLVNV